MQQANIIAADNIPHSSSDTTSGGQNSNSAIAFVLNAVGIDVRNTLLLGTAEDSPGIANFAK